MNCPNCGNPASPGAAQCTFCGTPFKPNQATPNPFAGDMPPGKPLPGQPAPQTARMEDDPALRMLIPIGRSPQAIFAGYAGLISFGCCLLGPIAVALGFVALKDIKQDPKLGGKWRAIFGIVTGVITTIALILGGIVLLAEALAG